MFDDVMHGLFYGHADVVARLAGHLDFARQVQVVPAALGQSAGLVGAAALILAAERYWTPD